MISRQGNSDELHKATSALSSLIDPGFLIKISFISCCLHNISKLMELHSDESLLLETMKKRRKKQLGKKTGVPNLRTSNKQQNNAYSASEARPQLIWETKLLFS